MNSMTTTTRLMVSKRSRMFNFKMWGGCFTKQPPRSLPSHSVLHIIKNFIWIYMRQLLTYNNVLALAGPMAIRWQHCVDAKKAKMYMIRCWTSESNFSKLLISPNIKNYILVIGDAPAYYPFPSLLIQNTFYNRQNTPPFYKVGDYSI